MKEFSQPAPDEVSTSVEVRQIAAEAYALLRRSNRDPQDVERVLARIGQLRERSGRSPGDDLSRWLDLLAGRIESAASAGAVSAGLMVDHHPACSSTGAGIA